MMWDKSEENALEKFWSSQPIPEKGRNRTLQEFGRVSCIERNFFYQDRGGQYRLIRPLLFIEPCHRKVLSDHNSVSPAIFMYRSSRASILSKLK